MSPKKCVFLLGALLASTAVAPPPDWEPAEPTPTPRLEIAFSLSDLVYQFSSAFNPRHPGERPSRKLVIEIESTLGHAWTMFTIINPWWNDLSRGGESLLRFNWFDMTNQTNLTRPHEVPTVGSLPAQLHPGQLMEFYVDDATHHQSLQFWDQSEKCYKGWPMNVLEDGHRYEMTLPRQSVWAYPDSKEKTLQMLQSALPAVQQELKAKMTQVQVHSDQKAWLRMMEKPYTQCSRADKGSGSGVVDVFNTGRNRAGQNKGD